MWIMPIFFSIFFPNSGSGHSNNHFYAGIFKITNTSVSHNVTYFVEILNWNLVQSTVTKRESSLAVCHNKTSWC